MAATVGSLNVNATLQTAQFDRNVDKMKGTLKGLQGSFANVGAKLTKAGAIMSIGITAPLAAFGKQAVMAAQDAQEMQSAFDVTFGDMAVSVRAWAEATGNAMGRSTQEMQRGALAFQELFGKALDPQKSAAMSKSFAVLTQDLASFKNLSNEVAQQKLLSGLAGEAEPLRAVGVFLSEAKVQAAALELGLVGVNGKLTEEQKILARAKVIQDELGKATGDVIRTQDSAANKAKEAAANYEEMSISLGEKLIPLKLKLTEIAIALLNAFSKLSPEAQNVALGAAAIGAALGPVMLVVGPMVSGFGALLPLLVKLGPAFVALRVAMLALLSNPVVLGAAALIGGIYLAWKNWDKITAIVQRTVQAVKTWLADRLAAVLDSAKRKVEAFAQPFVWLYNKLVGNSVIPDMVNDIASEMARLARVMDEGAQKATSKTLEAFQRLSGLLDRLFPEAARYNQFRRELAELEADAKRLGLTADQTAEAIRRLRQEYAAQAFGETGEPSSGLLNTPPLVGMDEGVAPGVAAWADQLSNLTQKTNEWAEAMKGVAFAAGDTLANGLTAVIMGAAKLGEVFSSVAKQIIADIIQMTIRMAIFRLVTAMLGGLGGPFTGMAAFTATAGIPGFAHGGSFKIGGLEGIDKNLLSINGVPSAAVSRGETVQIIPENDRGAGTAHVIVELNDPLLRAKIVSGAVEVVGAAAPNIVRRAASETMRAAGRPKLMGR